MTTDEQRAQHKLSAGSTLAGAQVTLSAFVYGCVDGAGTGEINVQPGMVSGTDLNYVAVTGWFPAVGLAGVMAAIVVTENSSAYSENELVVRSAIDLRKPNNPAGRWRRAVQFSAVLNALRMPFLVRLIRIILLLAVDTGCTFAKSDRPAPLGHLIELPAVTEREQIAAWQVVKPTAGITRTIEKVGGTYYMVARVKENDGARRGGTYGMELVRLSDTEYRGTGPNRSIYRITREGELLIYAEGEQEPRLRAVKLGAPGHMAAWAYPVTGDSGARRPAGR